jgi:hypothetical protein
MGNLIEVFGVGLTRINIWELDNVKKYKEQLAKKHQETIKKQFDKHDKPKALETLLDHVNPRWIYNICLWLDLTARETDKSNKPIEASKKIGESGYGDIMKKLHRFKRLENIELSLAGIKDATNGLFAHITDLVTFTHTKLIAFKLGFGEIDKSPSLTKDCMDPLCEALLKCKKMESLDFSFFTSKSITDAHVMKICETIGQFEKLKSLRFALFDCTTITDKSLEVLSKAIPKLLKITTLVICIERCPDIKNVGVENFFKVMVSKPEPKVEEKPEPKVDEKGNGKILSQTSIKSEVKVEPKPEPKSELTVLEITFKGQDITSELSLAAMSTSIQKFKKLTRLDITFNKCDNLHSLKSLGEAVKGLRHLQSISITAKKCEELTDHGLSDLGEGIAALPKILFIFFTFSRSPRISDSGLDQLATAISTIKQRIHLNWNFSYNASLTDQNGVGPMSSKFANMANLQTLTLKFNGCTKLGKDVIKEFGTTMAVAKSTVLSDISLSLVKAVKTGAAIIADKKRGY